MKATTTDNGSVDLSTIPLHALFSEAKKRGYLMIHHTQWEPIVAQFRPASRKPTRKYSQPMVSHPMKRTKPVREPYD
jgi:hypothetical protein